MFLYNAAHSLHYKKQQSSQLQCASVSIRSSNSVCKAPKGSNQHLQQYNQVYQVLTNAVFVFVSMISSNNVCKAPEDFIGLSKVSIITKYQYRVLGKLLETQWTIQYMSNFCTGSAITTAATSSRASPKYDERYCYNQRVCPIYMYVIKLYRVVSALLRMQ